MEKKEYVMGKEGRCNFNMINVVPNTSMREETKSK